MPRRPSPVPSYRLHKQSGQAIVTVRSAEGCRRDVLLGPHGSPESTTAYERILADLRIGPSAGAPPPPLDPSVNQVLLAFLTHASSHYRRPDTTPTGEVKEFKLSVRPVRLLYGTTPARAFGPLALKAVRDWMVGRGLCRTLVNRRVGRIKHVFKWAASEELVPAAVHAALATVAGLRRGRTAARESDPVRPADPAVVDATLPHLTPTVRAMVELQRLTGMRPGEVRGMTAADIDRSGPAWVYRPAAHKTAHRGLGREVVLGPRARGLLGPLLDAAADLAAALFSPARSREEWYAMRRAARKSRVTPSQVCRRLPADQLRKRPRDRFTDHGYAQAVRKGAARARVAAWHPNQLRHLFATTIRRSHGLEAAQVLLGHQRADVTQVYAERDAALAVAVAEAVG